MIRTEALAEPAGGGGWLVKAPRVGLFRECPRAGGHRSAGDRVGTLGVLGRKVELLLPAGVDGLVTDIRIHDLEAPVEYGQPLFRLAPLALGGSSGRLATAGSGHTGARDGSLPEGCLPVTCPIEGVFYGRPSPGADPFVRSGDVVAGGRTLGLIEAMKSFNAVVYGGPGLPSEAVIVEVRAEDATEVKQGVVLFVVRPLARTIHEASAATVDLPALPGVLASRPLDVSQRIRLASSPLRLPGMTAISTVSRRTFMNGAG